MRSQNSRPTRAGVVRVVAGFVMTCLLPFAHAWADTTCTRPATVGAPLVAVAYSGPAAFTAVAVAYSPDRRGRPALSSVHLPDNLKGLDVAARKASFVETILPLLVDVNRHIAETRARIESLAQWERRGCPLEDAELRWLAAVAFEYEVDPRDTRGLLQRVDTIPLSLSAAQAAIETAWGTSRFVREGNALFGERTYDPSVPGMKVPNRTAFRVRSFPTLYDSVVQYANNLNTHEAYERFRTLRAAQRTRSKPFDPDALAATLDLYSERGGWYTNTLVSIMSFNRFYDLDAIRVAAAN
jgi:Bax protein